MHDKSYEKVRYLRLLVASFSVVPLFFILIMLLDLLLLLAYHRLGKKLSNRAKLLVTKVLRSDSAVDSIEIDENKEDF